MKKSKSMRISILIVSLLMLFVVNFFFNQDKNKPQKAQVPAQSTQKQVDYLAKNSASISQATALDYDSVMANDHYGQNRYASVDYYTLSLSWSPAFCEIQKERHNGNLPKSLQYQCGGSQQFGWVIHGLWPQNAKARSISEQPRFCQGDLAELPETTIQKYLPESPGAALLQGEWEKHGACAFKTAEQYFDKQKELFMGLKLPKYELSKTELFRWLRKNNPQLENVYMGATKTELFICYDKQWHIIDCPKNQLL